MKRILSAIQMMGNNQILISCSCEYVDFFLGCDKVKSTHYCENLSGTFQCHIRTTPAETTEAPTTTPVPTSTEAPTTTPVPSST